MGARHPELAWPDAPFDPAAARRLAALADDLGTTLVPQFNALGHASGSRWKSGKHATLDFRPKLEPLFEPGGWNWCLSNPDAVAAVRDVVEEMHDGSVGLPALAAHWRRAGRDAGVSQYDDAGFSVRQ